MIDSLLPSRIGQTRAKIREVVGRFDESQASSWSLGWPGPERAVLGTWLDRLEPLAESFKPGHKKSVELLWLVEELAAGFPRITLIAVVWWGVIIPVLNKAKLGGMISGSPRAGLTSPEESSLAYNHLFLPPPASRTFKLLVTRMVGRSGAEDEPGQCFPVFDLPAPRRILIPAAARSENRPGSGVVYYLVEDEGLSLEPGPVGKWLFPFRPARCRITGGKASTSEIEPILDLKRDQFQARLEDYFLMLAAVFSGWARAGWQGLVHGRQAGSISPDLDTEISYLATEIGRLQHGLFHLSQSRSIPGDCYSRKVEKLCLLGLHLASRAWRHWPGRVRQKIYSQERKDEA